MGEVAGRLTVPSTRPAMTRSRSEGMLPPDTFMAVIEHDARAAVAAAYEAWLPRVTACAQRFPGHAGVTILRGFSRDEIIPIPCGEAG